MLGPGPDITVVVQQLHCLGDLNSPRCHLLLLGLQALVMWLSALQGSSCQAVTATCPLSGPDTSTMQTQHPACPRLEVMPARHSDLLVKAKGRHAASAKSKAQLLKGQPVLVGLAGLLATVPRLN